MNELLKKNWFVIIVAFILIGATGFYIKDQAKNTVSGKKVGGKQVVFSIANKNFFASDFEELLNEEIGDSALYQIFERVLLTNIEATQDMISDAKLRAESTILYVKQTQGAKGLEQMESDLIGMGYDGIDSLNEYYENLLKYEALVRDYFITNYDRLFKEDHVKEKPRFVSHILVRMEDSANPTEDEQAKLDKIDALLKEGKSFGDVALAESADTESAQNKGSLGVVDANTNLVTPFLEATLKLKKGEVSDWVETTYGRHLIRVDETDFKELIEDSSYLGKLIEKQGHEIGQVLWDKAQALNIEFLQEGIEDRLRKVLDLDKEVAE